MPDPGAIVGTVDLIESATPQGHRTVRFTDGSFAYLTSDGINAQALETLRDIGEPAYVRVTQSNEVQDVLIPIVGRVMAIEPTAAGHRDVQLEGSCASHLLKASAPEFGAMLALLETSHATQVAVTVTDTPDAHEIFDVREAPSGFIPAVAPTRMPELAPESPMISTMNMAQAEELFREVRAQSCTLPEVAGRCIPFLYPDTGCWVRAHLMWDWLRAKNLGMAKQWLFGPLTIRTRNHPCCGLTWNWHVAPVVRIESIGGDQLHVIDPSVGDSVVSMEAWVASMNGEGATRKLTEPDWYFPLTAKLGWKDPDGTLVSRDLQKAQLALRQRADGHAQPPPYPACDPERTPSPCDTTSQSSGPPAAGEAAARTKS